MADFRGLLEDYNDYMDRFREAVIKGIKDEQKAGMESVKVDFGLLATRRGYSMPSSMRIIRDGAYFDPPYASPWDSLTRIYVDRKNVPIPTEKAIACLDRNQLYQVAETMANRK